MQTHSLPTTTPIIVPLDEWLVLDKVDCLLNRPAALRVMLRSRGGGSGPPGRSGACWCRRWWQVSWRERRGGCPAGIATVGVGVGEGEYRYYVCLSKKGPFSQIESLVVITAQATMTANPGGPAPAASLAGCAQSTNWMGQQQQVQQRRQDINCCHVNWGAQVHRRRWGHRGGEGNWWWSVSYGCGVEGRKYLGAISNFERSIDSQHSREKTQMNVK